MSTATAENAIAKPRRRSVARSPKGGNARSVKIGVYITPESARRLGITATMEGRDRSAIIDELITVNLRKYVVQIRGGASADAVMIGEEGSAA